MRKEFLMERLRRAGFGVIDNTGYLDVKKGDIKETLILDGDELPQLEMLLNLELFKSRENKYNSITGPRIGDWVKFPNGVMNRITYIWDAEPEREIQTGGYGSSFYIGFGYISYSGGLDLPIPESKFRDTGKKKKGRVWLFKNDFAFANNGITFDMNFRVFECSSIPADQKN